MSSPPPGRLWRREDTSDKAVIVFTEPRIVEESKIQAAGEQLVKLAEQLPGKTLVLNFEAVDHLSSSMLAKVVLLHKKMLAGQGKLVLCGLKPEIYANILTTNLHKILDIRRVEDLGLGPATRTVNLPPNARATKREDEA